MPASLPPALAERLEPGAPAPRAGEFVVYWMRAACRATENPALDVALAAARALKRPVFVFLGLSGRNTTSRRLTFQLEGVRDVQAGLVVRGVPFACSLERPSSPPQLLALAKRAALVVTDFVPLPGQLAVDAAVAQAAPLWRVDASCVAPVWRSTRRAESPRDFHADTHLAWAERLRSPWVDEGPPLAASLPGLPFAPLVLDDLDVSALVSACPVDFTVPPVAHTRGGSSAAQQRWEVFRDEGLVHLADRRKSGLHHAGSQLSAALAFGFLSPFSLAREARQQGGPGAEAFLDGLLTRREFAFNVCLHAPEVFAEGPVPAWARPGLRASAPAQRGTLYSWEQLARAQTAEPLWNACQRLLLAHGALPQALRVTWARTLRGWCRADAEALALAVELNDRFALDGQSPGSVVGVLEAMGAFDEAPARRTQSGTQLPIAPSRAEVDPAQSRAAARGNLPEVSLRGTPEPSRTESGTETPAASLRTEASAPSSNRRSISAAELPASPRSDQAPAPPLRRTASGTALPALDPPPPDDAPRLDVAELERRAHRPASGHVLAVAIVGAGVAGTAAARVLVDAGHHVTLFDEGEGLGGRAASPRLADTRVDAGAPCFAVTDERFKVWARGFWKERMLAEWRPAVVVTGVAPPGAPPPSARVVALPSMSSLVERLQADLDVRRGQRVHAVVRDGERWRLKEADAQPLGEYDALVVATPPGVAAALLDAADFALASRLREVVMQPTWTVLAEFSERLDTGGDLFEVHIGPLHTAARDSSKPGRPHGERWVLHATHGWSTAHADETPDAVRAQLLEAFFVTTGVRPVKPSAARVLRWGEARAKAPLGEVCLGDVHRQLVVCGDWCLGFGVEAAFLSGSAAGARLVTADRGGPGAAAPRRPTSQLPLL